ncbi:hypothetical protein [Kitasatospora sp. NPDC017646]|uniref:hypothetical protein n=1 Tax=Kitasatospora sp. NPDC017646 TaxID=3364024 RepID=UPI00378A7297
MVRHPYDNVQIDEPEFVLSALGEELLHAATAVAPAHTLHARMDITGDRSITVSVDHQHAREASGRPALGSSGSLLGHAWWSLSALAALSAEVTTVELWCAGRGFRQDCEGLRPLKGIRELQPPTGSGTHLSLALDPAHL